VKLYPPETALAVKGDDVVLLETKVGGDGV